jgi:hypothetical protein
LWSEVGQGKKHKTVSEKLPKQKRTEGVFQVEEHLPNEPKAPISNTTIPKQKTVTGLSEITVKYCIAKLM